MGIALRILNENSGYVHLGCPSQRLLCPSKDRIECNNWSLSRVPGSGNNQDLNAKGSSLPAISTKQFDSKVHRKEYSQWLVVGTRGTHAALLVQPCGTKDLGGKNECLSALQRTSTEPGIANDNREINQQLRDTKRKHAVAKQQSYEACSTQLVNFVTRVKLCN